MLHSIYRYKTYAIRLKSERTNGTNERTIEWTSEQMLTIKCRAWVIYKNKWARMTSTVAAASASTRSAYITKAGSLYKQRVHRTHTHTHSLTYTRIYAYTIYMAGARASWEFDTHIWKKNPRIHSILHTFPHFCCCCLCLCLCFCCWFSFLFPFFLFWCFAYKQFDGNV